MKEFLQLLKRFDLKAIFFTPTTNGLIQFFRYVFVGGIATIVDWGVLFLLTDGLGIHHLISAIFSFIAGLAANFVLSKLFVFKANEARVEPRLEFLAYGFIGVIGLGMTELILLCCTGWLHWHYMLSKVIATALVLVWNYLARKMLVYKQ